MKPLPAANLSHEDCVALVFVTLHRNKSIAALTIRHAMCLESDRRDAELMFRAQGSRSMAWRMTELDAVSPRWQWELIVELSDGEMGTFGGRML